MNDLETINRKNADAVKEAATKAAADGKLVLAKYSGLNFVDYSVHDTEGERNAASIAWNNESPGNRTAFGVEA